MALFLQCCIVAMGIFIFLISIYNRKIPRGLLEWLFIIGTFIVFAVWIFKY